MGGEARTWHVPGIGQWPQRGGAASLDFANTVAYRPTAKPVDGLRTYDDLLSWSCLAGMITPEENDRLASLAQHDERQAIEALDAARSLREAMYDVFQAISSDDQPDSADLATIAEQRVAGMMQATLSTCSDGFEFAIKADVVSLKRPLWRIAESTTQLLLSGDWRRVHICPGHDCGWLFLDQTKNGNRRWCDSAHCGNRARARTYAQRHRQGQQAASV